MTDDEVGRIEQQMKRFAEVEEFCYATTFYEYQSGSYSAFDELNEELMRAEARHVVVPSISHISTHPILQSHMVERLKFGPGAHVFELSGRNERPQSTDARTA